MTTTHTANSQRGFLCPAVTEGGRCAGEAPANNCHRANCSLRGTFPGDTGRRGFYPSSQGYSGALPVGTPPAFGLGAF